MSYVVVFGSGDDCWDINAEEGQKCLQGRCYGPFETRAEAAAFADSCPPFVVHFLMLQDPTP